VEVQVKLYGALRRYRPTEIPGARHQPFQLTLSQGASITSLIEQLAIESGRVSGVAVNGESAGMDTVLVEGDEVKLFPPSAGGQAGRVFLAGIMQGSRADDGIEGQDYRTAISQALVDHIPGVEIIDPFARNPDSVDYNLERARQTFVTNTALAAEADVLIAYLPQASMGTAIEMWTAYHAQKYIIAVTPLEHNWVVKVTANEVLPDLTSLLDLIQNGRLAEMLAQFQSG
jgi:molybdopterin converting factor small subunit